ncbi:hypothetical protein ARMSODRAFT_1083499 [Armillaria solidipes]|uniref:Uncharacterized protein n=1 Tax=Armillaria solidipes TaxID=1076256 RepID=A0A2H3BWD1_9AGAR|nr:hypothetical protein ARMSODRAFT_1083499 [Armillaria solidipes]
MHREADMDITPDASVAMDIDNLEDEIPSSSPDNSGHALWKASQTPNVALRDLIVESSESVTYPALNKHVPRWDGPSSPQERRKSAPYNVRHRPPPRRSASTVLPPVTLTSTNLSGAIPTLYNLIEKVQSAESGDENSEQISAPKSKTRGREKAATGRKTGRSSMLPPLAPKGKGKEKERPQDSYKDVNKRRRSGAFAAPIPSLLASPSTTTFSDVSMLDVSSDNMGVEHPVLSPPPPPLLIPTRSENTSGRSRTSSDGEVPECPTSSSGKAHGKRPSAPSKVVETTSSSNDVAHVAPTSPPEAPSKPKTTSQTRLGDNGKAAACLSLKANKAPSAPSKRSSTRNLRSSSSINRTEVIRQALEGNINESQPASVSIMQGSRSTSRGVTPQPTLSSNGSRPSTSSVASSRSISRQPPSQPPVSTQPKPPGTDPCHRPPPQLGMGVRRVSSAPTAQLAHRPLPTHQKGFKLPLLSGTLVPKPVERPPPPPPPPPQNEASSEDTSFDCSFDLDPEELDNAMQEFD